MKLQYLEAKDLLNLFVWGILDDYFTDTYQQFFDELIYIHKVPIDFYNEKTDELCRELISLEDKLIASDYFYFESCDTYFDFYYRFRIVDWYLDRFEEIEFESSTELEVLEEMFLKTWRLVTYKFYESISQNNPL